MRIAGFLVLMLAAVSAVAQPQTGAATTRGACSPAVTGSNNSFVIKSCGLTAEETENFLKILNRLVSQQPEWSVMLKKLDACLGERTLSKQQKEILLAALLPWRGHKIEIISIVGDKDGKRYAEEFANVFRSAGWTGLGDIGHKEISYGVDPEGIEILVSHQDVEKNTVPLEVFALFDALKKANVDFYAHNNLDYPAGLVSLIIGLKPRSIAPHPIKP